MSFCKEAFAIDDELPSRSRGQNIHSFSGFMTTSLRLNRHQKFRGFYYRTGSCDNLCTIQPAYYFDRTFPTWHKRLTELQINLKFTFRIQVLFVLFSNTIRLGRRVRINGPVINDLNHAVFPHDIASLNIPMQETLLSDVVCFQCRQYLLSEV